MAEESDDISVLRKIIAVQNKTLGEFKAKLSEMTATIAQQSGELEQVKKINGEQEIQIGENKAAIADLVGLVNNLKDEVAGLKSQTVSYATVQAKNGSVDSASTVATTASCPSGYQLFYGVALNRRKVSGKTYNYSSVETDPGKTSYGLEAAGETKIAVICRK